MTYQQHPPYAVQVELTEGCNLRCTFCGLSGIRGDQNDYKCMSVETAELIAKDIAMAEWTSRIEFAMHGEPTMNPDIVEIIKLFRRELPKNKLMITSNGGGLLADPVQRIGDLFRAGLDTLAIDQYQGIRIVPKIKARLAQELGFQSLDNVKTVAMKDGPVVHIHQYPEDKNGNPHQRKATKRLVFISPIDLNTKGTHATLNNHAGSGAPKDFSQEGKRCAKPFRELSFRWNGWVAVCCNDWRGEYVVGSIYDMGLTKIWNHPRFQAIRKRLYHGHRDVGPCHGCNAKSYRVGLLPDPLGKVDLEEDISHEELRIMDEAIKDGPLTEPVYREWEVEVVEDEEEEAVSARTHRLGGRYA